MARRADAAASAESGHAAPLPDIAAASSVVNSLRSPPAADGYTLEQKRGCLALALGLQDSRLAEVLNRLHQIALAKWKVSRSPEFATFLHGCLALLLDVRAGAADDLCSAALWRLARERGLRRTNRLLALALLLKSTSVAEEHLLKIALRSPATMSSSALCVLCDAELGAGQADAKQALAVHLGSGRKLPAAVAPAVVPILAALLNCDESTGKVAAALSGAGWSVEAVEAARRSLITCACQGLDLNVLKATLREPREQQLSRLSTFLQVGQEASPREVGLLRGLATVAAQLPEQVARVTLGILTGLPGVRVDDQEDSKAAKTNSEALAGHIVAGGRDLPGSEARLLALACLLRAPPRLGEALEKVGEAFRASALSAACCRSIVECLLLGEPVAQPEKGADRRSPASSQALLAALARVQDLPAASQSSLKDLIESAKVAEKQTDPVENPEPGGRFGMGALEDLLMEDEDDDEEAHGWDALKAALADQSDSESAPAAVAPAAKRPRTSEQGAASGASLAGPAVSVSPDEEDQDEEEEEEEEEEELVETIEDDVNKSMSPREEDSYCGSELDVDDQPQSPESNDGADEEGLDLGAGGLLTSMIQCGSLQSEEKQIRQRFAEKGADGSKRRLVFPSLIWRGKDVLVVNKPADWICSASDVDKRKGRTLDPNEKCQVKGFKVLDDLMQYKFEFREKKYIHWWIQLMHDLDPRSYPTLFDEDQNYGLCHRLDRETSGTVLVGLTELARTQMRECFHRHYVRKLYVCLAHGILEEKEQTVDKNLEAMGQKARLHPSGKRARTHVKVLGNFTRERKDGGVDEFTLCTCEIAEGRMHQIRLHMSEGLNAPIVSEFYYQQQRQMMEDRRWCQRVFLHAYAVGFPDVSGESRRVGVETDCGLKSEEEMDTKQEWHCCICPLTVELRAALQECSPKDDASAAVLKEIADCGLLDRTHEAVHVMGTEGRKADIDDQFFPWSCTVNPIEAGDISKSRDFPGGKGKGKFKGEKGDGKGKKGKQPVRLLRREPGGCDRDPPPRSRAADRPGTLPNTLAPAWERGRGAPATSSRGAPRCSRSPGQGAPPLRNPRRRGRSRSRDGPRRISGAPVSPRRSDSPQMRRLKRRMGSLRARTPSGESMPRSPRPAGRLPPRLGTPRKRPKGAGGGKANGQRRDRQEGYSTY